MINPIVAASGKTVVAVATPLAVAVGVVVVGASLVEPRLAGAESVISLRSIGPTETSIEGDKGRGRGSANREECGSVRCARHAREARRMYMMRRRSLWVP